MEIQKSWRYSVEFRVQLLQWRIGSLRDARCKRCFTGNVRQLTVLSQSRLGFFAVRSRHSDILRNRALNLILAFLHLGGLQQLALIQRANRPSGRYLLLDSIGLDLGELRGVSGMTATEATGLAKSKLSRWFRFRTNNRRFLKVLLVNRRVSCFVDLPTLEGKP